MLLSVIAITVPLQNGITDLSDALSQPGIPSRAEVEHMTITTPDGVSFEINGFDVTANSRLIDIITGLAIAEGQ
jgi:hypothetical protein